MKHLSEYLDSAFHDVTKIKASDTKHMQIIIRVHNKKQKPNAIQYKTFNKDNKNLEDNTWPFNN
jgi:uncharacterized protein YcfL